MTEESDVAAERAELRAAIHEAFVKTDARNDVALYALVDVIQAMTVNGGFHSFTLKVLFILCANIIDDAEIKGARGEPAPQD